MAIRDTKLVTKNSQIVNRPLPNSGLLTGEAIVNTADGIMWFSGVTTSSSEWTPAGTGATESTFFEVGSNLYDLRLRNKITQYENISGAGLTGKFLSGTTNGFVLADIADIADSTDSYVTGGTYNSTSDEITLSLNLGKPDVTITGVTDTFTTGGTLVGSTAYFDLNDGSLSAYTLDLSALDVNDTFFSGYSYNASNNTFTINRNDGTDFTAQINAVSGLSITNLTDGRVVYVGAGGQLTDEAGFEYDEGTDTLLAGNINTSATGSAFVGTGGLTVGSGGSTSTSGTGDVVIHGNLTVFGDAITASTGELYIEDNQITLNYNPTGDTSPSSVGAGLLIQDGDGSNNDVNFDIRSMNGFTGLTASEVPDISEYTGPDGYENRAFVTQLNDLVIRSNDVTIPNGVRVLAEFDILDGGQY